MRAEFVDRIEAVDQQQWNALIPPDAGHYPFVRYQFLQALEASGAVSARSGWQPQHLLVFEQQRLIAAMPVYLKQHSYGEYVFDWAWARAYQDNGLAYYPKLVVAIPFTPVTGPRLLSGARDDHAALWEFCSAALRARAEQLGASSLHLLFGSQQDSAQLAALALPQRIGVQFHWHNRGYRDFADFLATMSARKRKNIRRERQRVADQHIELQTLPGNQISRAQWQRFYQFYRDTYLRHSGHGGYLDAAFFQQLGQTMAEQIVLIEASQHGEAIAAALYFRDQDCLYGRYWGCLRDIDMLHFEACYYRGIDYCIEQGLKRFDPGAQGEHKIQRGFEPRLTYSNHWLAEPRFHTAVEDFLRRETPAVLAYQAQCRALLPFKQPADPAS